MIICETWYGVEHSACRRKWLLIALRWGGLCTPIHFVSGRTPLLFQCLEDNRIKYELLSVSYLHTWSEIDFHEWVPGYWTLRSNSGSASRAKWKFSCFPHLLRFGIEVFAPQVMITWAETRVIFPCPHLFFFCNCFTLRLFVVMPSWCVPGFYDAADHAAGQRPRQILRLLHQNPRHDVSRGAGFRAAAKMDLLIKKGSFPSGSRLLQKFDFPSMRFSLYFLGYEDKKEIPVEVEDRTSWTFSRRATIELTQ